MIQTDQRGRDEALALAQPRLLLIDDLEDSRIIIGRRFQRRGFAVTEAANGPEGLSHLAAGPFDIVLLDIMMPEMDGFETLRRIRDNQDRDELPVIMVTIRDGSEDVARALRLGANDYITKPLDFDIAYARVMAQVERKQALAAARRTEPDREALVEELRQALQDAEAAARAKSEFLANMSHEIRTPLNGILGMARVLVERCEDPALRRSANVIVDSAIGLERLLSDALDLSRAEAGKIEIRTEAFDLGALVERVTDLFGPAAAEKGLALHAVVAPEAQGVVLGDPLRIQQILTNLISNAVKFTEQGEVACRVVRDALSGEHRFEVRDSGIGFDPARVEALFDRFEQADASITSRFGGSGLGLAISRRLAELMGGALTASSEPGRGATFVLVVPLRVLEADETAAIPVKPATALAGDRRVRILAADDHAANRQLLELMLEPLGVELLLVSDGAHALEAWRGGDFDLVLMDVQMPVMDGLTAIRALRRLEQERGLGRTPVVALSAHASAEHVEMSLTAGADRHVTKPVRADVLFAAIQDLLTAAAEAPPATRGAIAY